VAAGDRRTREGVQTGVCVAQTYMNRGFGSGQSQGVLLSRMNRDHCQLDVFGGLVVSMLASIPAEAVGFFPVW
jgi:hypothetical protein